MSTRVTLERLLRDEDDAAAQTVRGWTLQIADGGISIGGREPGSAKFMIRVAEIGELIGDLNAAADAAEALERK